MSPIEMAVIAVVVFSAILLVVIFLIPSDQAKKRKKKKKAKEPVDDALTKEWEQKIGRLEGHIRSLKKDIEAMENKEKAQSKQLLVEQAKVKKLQEKLTQERGWQEKENAANEKKNHELQRIKDELVKLQENYSAEHTENLKLVKELKERKVEFDLLTSKRRDLELQLNDLQVKYDALRQDVSHLKKENIELNRKRDDTSWIAASEYQKLQKLYKEQEKKLERLERETKKNE